MLILGLEFSVTCITLGSTEVCTLGFPLVLDDGKWACRQGRTARGRDDDLQLDKVIFLGKLVRGKKDEDRLVRDNQLVCMVSLAWNSKMVGVQGTTAQGSWVQGSWVLGSWELFQ